MKISDGINVPREKSSEPVGDGIAIDSIEIPDEFWEDFNKALDEGKITNSPGGNGIAITRDDEGKK